MTSRSPQLLQSSFSKPFVIADYTSALSLCCAYARDAASEGRYLAAHGLFQSAVTYFERAQQLASLDGEFSFHDCGAYDNVLAAARAQLEECAEYVYPEGHSQLESVGPAEIEV